MLDHLWAAYPEPIRAHSAQKLAEELGVKVADSDGLARALALDPKMPILFATVSPSSKGIRRITEQFAADPAGKGKKALQKIDTLKPPLALFFRVQFPLASNDPSALYGAVSRVLKAEAQRCTEGKDNPCGKVDHQPHAIFKGEFLALSYLAAKRLTLDVALPLLIKADNPTLLSALSKLRENRGGPAKPRCEALDLNAALSACIDADAAAHYFEFLSICRLLGAVSRTAIDPEQVQKICKQGLQESASIPAIANKQPRWLDDGTFSITGPPGKSQVLGSWLTNADSKKKLSEKWSKPRCVESAPQAMDELLKSLQESLGERGPEFGDLGKAVEQFREAGWGAWLIALGRQWPLYLEMLRRGGASKIPIPSTYCLGLNRERLELNAKLDLDAFRSTFPGKRR